jgi:aspartate aminotransferase-like enzyme
VTDTRLLDPEPLRAEDVARAEDGVARLLGVDAVGVDAVGAGPGDRHRDVLLVQAEAIAALEAVARSVAAPGTTAVNVVTGPYGALFGDWMRASGARVVDVRVPFDDVVTADAVRDALDAEPGATVLALVHAEAATGGTNPVGQIAALARERGLLTVLDAVASVGAEPVTPAEWGIDVTVIGPQKALAGPAGVSAVAVSDAAWAVMDANPAAPRASFLSLLDLRDAWTRAGRAVIPGTPNVLETRALLAALDRVAAEGLDAVIARHAAARDQLVAGLDALGLTPWQSEPHARAAVATAVRLVPGLGRALGGIVGPGNGPLAADLLRINHAGRAATPAAVADALDRLGGGHPLTR